ncbi:hypothetical protein QJQ45_023533 [Haematococcus lacustris]|nr:hypothetical protein QJQ45_023533 [Haematococcus lacustris]
MAAVLLLLATCLGWLELSTALQKHHLYREPIVNNTLQREMEACGDFGPGAWTSRKIKTPRLPEGARALWGTLYTQRRVWEVQHPYDCRTAKLAFYSLPADGHGIGSSLHLLGHALGISMNPESWVSVYVRRGDKAKENSEMLKDPKPFLDRATRFIRDNPRTVAPRIFLATEDVGVHSYFLANASVPVFAANVTRYNEDIGYSPMDHARRIGPDVEFINALMSLEITMTGDAFVFAMVSNWGRLINEMRSTVQCKADSDFFDPEQPNGITRLNWR